MNFAVITSKFHEQAFNCNVVDPIYWFEYVSSTFAMLRTSVSALISVAAPFAKLSCKARPEGGTALITFLKSVLRLGKGGY